MVRLPLRRKRKSPIPRLQGLVEAGLTTSFAIGLATGIPEKEIALLMVERIEPTDEQREILDALLKNYRRAIKFVNAETMRGRL